ncbi:MAG TPA: AMP-binding protein, partial [Candidatus Brocadiaceae bacterium]
MTLVKVFLNTRKRHAEKTAVIDQNREITYGTLHKDVLEYAALLLSRDTSNHVGILLPNCIEFVTAFYGILMAGKTPVP